MNQPIDARPYDPDWAGLWYELATAFWRQVSTGGGRNTDRWSKRARNFDISVKRRRDEADPLRQFVMSHLDADSTFLDIGAGTGSWAVPVARKVQWVTALEPSPSMMAILQENLKEEGLDNVDFMTDRWEEAAVSQHDFVLCSHAMYTSPDLIGFVRKMEGAARQACFLLMRVPAHDGVLGELSRAIYGHPHDSPNFIVAYNALLAAGIYPSVMMDPRVRHWTNASLDEAFQRAKRHLHLKDQRYDDLIHATLARKLQMDEGGYVWPDGMRSALLWWEPKQTGSPEHRRGKG